MTTPKTPKGGASPGTATVLAVLATLFTGGCYLGVRLPDGAPSAGEDDDAGGGEGGGAAEGDDGGDGGSGDDGSGGPQSSCDGIAAGHAPLRRLTSAAYANTIRDVLGIDVTSDLSLEPDEIVAGYRHNLVDPVTQLGAENYLDAAETIAERVVVDGAGELPCDPASPECGATLAETLGRRLLRRSLTPQETQRLADLHASTADPTDGARLVLQALLQSPWFLYLVEVGDVERAEEHRIPFTSHELAARLSYLLWESAPDDELLDLADADMLADPEALRAQAERMLADPRAARTIASFHRQWLTLPEYELEHVEKDPEMFPEFGASLQASMQREIDLRADLVIRHGEGTLDALMRSSTTVVDDELAAVYGVDRASDAVPSPPGLDLPEGTSLVQLPANERAGLLGLAGIWATLAKPNNTNIPLRGQFIAERLLCLPIQPPPVTVDAELPPADSDATARQRLEQETSVQPCAGCHQMINPLGFAVESYDGIGAFRTTDEFGHSIDATAELLLPGLSGFVDGPVELAEQLAETPDLPACVAGHWFRFGFGLDPADTDASECGFEEILAQFEDSGHDLRVLLTAIATSDAFRYRPR